MERNRRKMVRLSKSRIKMQLHSKKCSLRPKQQEQRVEWSLQTQVLTSSYYFTLTKMEEMNRRHTISKRRSKRRSNSRKSPLTSSRSVPDTRHHLVIRQNLTKNIPSYRLAHLFRTVLVVLNGLLILNVILAEKIRSICKTHKKNPRKFK